LPVFGFTLFIFFAAYHFGETDLYYFNTKGIFGKLFVISYGLLILGVILLQHFNEVMPLLQLFDAGKANTVLIQMIETNRTTILSLFALAFFSFTFIYFLLNQAKPEEGKFLIHFAIVLIILFYLPMILGLSFYFIAWHSILSITNIVGYLRKNENVSVKKIIGQIVLYSSIAIAGIVAVGLSGFMFISNDTMMVYVILGLAVLTAPHMQIMHDMYLAIRLQKLQHS
jgi:Brp/Blh family beta-carotene 15,15'-monooxygenase